MMQPLLDFTGPALRDQGLTQVEEHHSTWVELMKSYARAVSKCQGSVSADDLRPYEHDFGYHHANAWGAIFRGKNWQCVGWRQSEHPGNHARMIRVWKWVD